MHMHCMFTGQSLLYFAMMQNTNQPGTALLDSSKSHKFAFVTSSHTQKCKHIDRHARTGILSESKGVIGVLIFCSFIFVLVLRFPLPGEYSFL